MDTLSADLRARASQGRPRMVFDWVTAAKIIRDEKPDEAWAGLAGDWGCDYAVIFRNGEIVEDCDTYLASTWAVPQIQINGYFRDCYVTETEWGPETKWPDEARAILKQ